jgi:LysM repeat protein
MKSLLLAASTLFLSAFAFAQNLLVHHSEKGLYVEHKVVPKESFFSVGRLYAIPPKDIAAYNNLDMNKGLIVGQVIKVPLTDVNFSQTTDAGKAVYYEVGAKEGLYRVSLKNNNVLMANLRKWNGLKNDNIKTGEKLIVGYITGETKENPIAVTKEQTKDPIIKQETEEVKPVAKKPEPVVEKKTEEVKPQPIETKPVQTQPAYANTYTSVESYFKKEFEAQSRTQPATKEQMATSGIFKTASGWQDGKYYAMIDGVEPGTIIKVVNGNNNKTIYAKVLSEMSGIRQNQGYELRISNAAASALDITDTDKFVVKVNF